MNITDAQTLLNSNPAAGLLARRDISDIVAQLKQMRPARSVFFEGQLATLDNSLPGKSAAAQLVTISDARDTLGRELLRVVQENQDAQKCAADNAAAARAADNARAARQNYVERTTRGATSAIQEFQFRVGGLLNELGMVEGPADLQAFLTSFDDAVAGARGSIAAALAPHIAAVTDSNAKAA